MAVYTLKVTTLTPLHIGDGNELRQGFDFVVYNRRTYRLDVDALLAARGDRLRPDRMGNYPLPSSLLEEADFARKGFFRYALPGFPRSSKADARLRSCIKDVYDRPYIPGSSLKGALRTALAWCGWSEVNPRLDRSAIGQSRSWAAQGLERRLFGRDPNHDLLRALQVSDCFGPGEPGAGLAVVNAQVLTLRAAGSPVELEAVMGDVVFQGTLHIDETLFSRMAEPQLGFANRRRWLDEVLPRVQKHSRARLQKLAGWFEQSADGARVGQFYRRLLGLNLPPNQAVVQLGWGTGWDGMTLGSHLQKDPNLFEQIVRDFRLHKANRNAPPRKPGDPFPRSKRAVMGVVEGRAAAVAPLGWALLELTPA